MSGELSENGEPSLTIDKVIEVLKQEKAILDQLRASTELGNTISAEAVELASSVEALS